MNDEFLTHAMSNDSLSPLFDSPPTAASSQSPLSDQLKAEPSRRIVVAATFTADLLQRPLQFWMDTLAISAEVVLAPYGQLLQELLDPESAASRNDSGFVIVLLRIQDWLRDRPADSVAHRLEHLRTTLDEFIDAMSVHRQRTAAPLVVFFCPSGSSPSADEAQMVQSLREHAMLQLGKLENTHCLSHEEAMRLYPLASHEDCRADEIAHIPYTSDYFTAIATLLARRIAVLSKPVCKVIAVDCDNTLWRGVCAEDGPEGIEITAAHRRLQQMLVRQHDAGVLLCLCSKNNPADVDAVFQDRLDMPLRPEHIITSRVNWNAKSENLQSIAEELSLGLDSFILIDDSALECAEVRAHCPAVAALHFPQSEHDIDHFLEHMWAFDRVGVTADAKQRTAQYRLMKARDQALHQATDLEKFLTSLQLEVDVTAMQPAQLARVAELVQRTNQFNLTTIRRSPGEIEQLWKSGELNILVINVRDRFGDYGLVGTVFYHRVSATIEVDTFLLSCRVLGRGVERCIVDELTNIARQAGLPTVTFRYRPTPRNTPARTFVEKAFGQFRAATETADAASCFEVPAGYVMNLPLEPEAAANTELASTTSPAMSTPAAVKWHEVAYRYGGIEDVIAEVNRGVYRKREGASAFLRPRNRLEAAVAEIWAEVLLLDEVGVRDDFFELGGDSLRAVQVISRIDATLGLQLPLHAFFETPTIEVLSSKLVDGDQPAIQARQTGADRVPLSLAQRRLWFIDRLEGGSDAYHIPLAMRLKGDIDLDALTRAFDDLVHRHEALRAVVADVDGEPVQKFQTHARFQLQRANLTSLPEAEREAELVSQAKAEVAEPFDLARGPLFRGRLLQLADQDSILMLTLHHLICDGWSLGVLTRELQELYAAHRSGHSAALPPLAVQYGDYAEWQRRWVVSGQLQQQLDFWKSHLLGAPELLQLPTDRPRPAHQSHRGANAPVLISADLYARLKEFSRRHNLTLAMTLHGAWAMVLAQLSGMQDIVIGVPVANRRRLELERLIGLFVNTLAVRVRVDEEATIGSFMHRVRTALLEAYGHQDAPFEQVVEALHPMRRLSHSPIFQVMVVLQPPMSHSLNLPGLSATEHEMPSVTAQFDLSLTLRDSGEAIAGSLNYATDLFDAETIVRWAGYFHTALEAITREPQKKVATLSLMTESERHQLLDVFNVHQAAYPRERMLHELFEEQVARTPETVALVYNGETLSYRQLNANANQLAAYLRRKGVGPDRLVGLCLDRGFDMVVGLLATWKAGGAYVPLDPHYPSERLRYIVGDAAPTVLLTTNEWRDRLPQDDAEVIALDECHEIGGEATDNLRLAELANSSNLAYVIYTSGSTGQPKGVMIEHKDVTNLCRGLNDLYGAVSECARVALNASFNFDASVQQLVQLLSGRTLFVLPLRVRQDVNQLVSFLEEHRIQGLDCTPSQLSSWVDAGLLERASCELRVVLVGGEAISEELWYLLAGRTRTEFYNVYGPTECTVDATAARLRDDPGPPHIGRPMCNRRVYIVDRQLHLAPRGVAGEIYVGGVGIARGYLHLPELTTERFVRDPFSADPQARMYKTGDLGRWRADGTLEYLGRNDNQVKIRGFRVEPGEIEAALTRDERVKEAVVVAREDEPGEKRLVAYLVWRVPSQLASIEELRNQLHRSLPEYMVPSAFVTLDRLPLTPSGKLDRRALPAPERDAFAKREYQPPRGEVEEILAGLWQELLRVGQIGRLDNFFELGGHSLLIMEMIKRLRRVGLATDVRTVFETSTLSDLAAAVSAVGAEFEVPPNLIPQGCQRITPEMLTLVQLQAEHIEWIAEATPGGAANIQDIYPLAPLQGGILFHHLLDTSRGDIYVVPVLLALSSRSRLDDLIAALQSAIDRHDVLRTAVLWEGLPTPVQVVNRAATLPVEKISLDPGRDSLEQVQQWLQPQQQRLDLRRAPLMRLRVAQDPRSERWYVLLQSHHIAGDNTSQDLLDAEVVARLNGSARSLADTIPYRHHVARVLAGGRSRDDESFFRAKLGDVDEATMPFGLANVHEGFPIEHANQQLAPELAQRVRSQARGAGVSAATIFHAAWGLVAARTSGRDDVLFATVLLGRSQESAGRGLGMFINTLPLRLRLEGVTAKALIEQTQRELVELLNHEQASLAVAQRCSGVEGSGPLFSSLLNYHHGLPEAGGYWRDAAGIEVLWRHDLTNYPITISIADDADGFALSVQCDARVNANRVVAYMCTALESLVEALEHAPMTSACALQVLPETERRQVLQEFNATRAYPSKRSIHEIFEAYSARAPQAIAAIYENEQLTYAALNGRANQLARHLRAKGVQANQLVGLCVERGLDLVVGLLGILKAGGAYLPLDPSYPAERLQHMMEDAAPIVVLTQASLRELVGDVSKQLVFLDGDWPRITAEPEDDLKLEVSPHQLAYVIYTSGSTGKPKGVMVEHRNVTRLFAATEHWFAFNERDVWTMFHSFAFDFSVWEIWGALLYGGRLVVTPYLTTRSPEQFYRLLCEQQVTVLNQTPSAFAQLIDAQARSDHAHSLRFVIFGGEALELHTLRPWVERNGVNRPQLVNMYGITETTVHVTYRRLTEQDIAGERASVIGTAIPDLKVLLLDAHRQLIPVGVVGEMYVGGAGVARGYLNRPELTADRFIADPSSTDPHARLYKSGDLGRWRADGSLEYLGRNDAQVKIRGFRIELGEIEARLAGHPRVKDVAVIAREDLPGEKRLVAYLVAHDRINAPSNEELRAYLKSTLPDHMVPGAFVALDQFPLTPNGKLNRKALPAPELDAYASREYEPPQSEVEQILVDIWRELLHVERVGRHDEFFELGGHSLSAMQVVTRIRTHLEVEVPVRLLFQHPTIAGLGAELEAIRRERPSEAPEVDEEVMEDLLDRVSSLQEDEVLELLQKLRMEAR